MGQPTPTNPTADVNEEPAAAPTEEAAQESTDAGEEAAQESTDAE